MWQYKATLLRVVDADTVDLCVELHGQTDLGFRIYDEPAYFRDRFRLYGIDAPERGEVGWAEGKAALEVMLPFGTVISIETHHPKQRDERDSFGRWLAIIYLDGVNINQRLIDEGHAKEYVR